MDYNITIYKTDSENKYRYALGALSAKPLFVIGLNPSTADDKVADPTIKKVMGFAEQNGYSSFVMLNLYPERSPYPDDLPLEADSNQFEKNVQIILELISTQEQADILLAWGDNIYSRDYLLKSIHLIYKTLSSHKVNWWRISDLTKRGQPRHPLYISYQKPFCRMDMKIFLSGN